MSAGSDPYQEYIQHRVNPVLEALVTQLLLERPAEPVPFMIKWLSEQFKAPIPGADVEEVNRLKQELKDLKAKIEVLEKAQPAGGVKAPAAPAAAAEADKDDAEEEEDEEDDDDDVEDLPEPPKYNRGPRASVSAEAYGVYNKKESFTAPVYAKDDATKDRLKKILTGSFMFSALEAKDLDTVVDAMQERKFQAKQRFISEGEDGDVLFVVDSGYLECFKKINGEEKMVKRVETSDVVGELALLYSQPRQASVEAAVDAICWELDRNTFNHIVKDASMKKREQYEAFLKSVKLLSSMEHYERSKVADALQQEKIPAKSNIITEGEEGEKFYILMDGTCEATKSGRPDEKVMHYEPGEYFGELALLKAGGTRQATVTAVTDVTVLTLDRKAFTRLLGPLEDLQKRQYT